MKKSDVRKFFSSWQKEYPNFKTPKVKKIMQKKNYVFCVSAGAGALDKKPSYSATAYKLYQGRMKGALGKPKVQGFKRMKGAKMFKSQVEAKMYAKKMMKKYK